VRLASAGDHFVVSLVAALYLYEVPVLIGDVVVSHTGPAGKHVYIPTRNDLADLLPSNWQLHISGLRRKVARLHDRLVVGWTGHLVVAQRVVADLRTRYREQEPDRADLFAFLESYSEFGRGVECDLLGWLLDGGGLTSFVWDSVSRKVTARGTERNYIYGSGKEDLFALIQQHQTFHSDDQTPAEKAASTALALGAQVIADELMTGRTLYTRYGGAMETLYLADGKFVAFEDVTLLFWEVAIDIVRDTFRWDLAPIMMKYLYVGESLCIYTMRFDKGFSEFPTSQEVFLVSPVDLQASPIPLPNDILPMDAKFYCNFVHARVADLGTIRLVINMPHEADGPVEFVREGVTPAGDIQRMSFSVRETFLKLLHDAIEPMIDAMRLAKSTTGATR
jgi:hypothetical protein